MGIEDSDAMTRIEDPATERTPTAGLDASLAGIWALAWPTMAAMGAATFVRFTDFAMVGDLGSAALAGVGLGGQVYWLVESAALLVPTGLAAILARGVGSGDEALVDQSFRQSLLLGSLISILSMLPLFPLTRWSIGIYGVEDAVIDLGADYLWWRLWGTWPLALGFVFASGLRAAGDVRTPLYIGLVTNVVNVFLNWVLIYGKLGAPALGVAGSAMASTIAMFVQLALFAWLWSRERLVIPARSRDGRPIEIGWSADVDMFGRLTRIGTPAAVESGLFQIGLLFFQRIMSLFGTDAIAAYNVGAQVLAFSFIPGIGFATAAATLVGQQLGARELSAATRSGWRSAAGSIGAMTAFGALLVASAEPISSVFTNDPEVIALTVDFIWILGIAHPLIAIEFAIGGALRGAGDTLFPMISVFVGLLCIRLPLAAGLAVVLDAPVQWVWCALIADYLVKAVMLSLRFRGGRWQRRDV